MKKNKLTIRFSNPNTEDETIKYLSRLFLEAGRQQLNNMSAKQAAREEGEDEHNGLLPSVNGQS